MITLYAFGPFFDLPDASPYVMKTEIQLKMAGLAYEKDFSGFPNAPKGKLPYIADGETIVADSTFIRAHLEKTRKFDLDAFLTPRQRAEAWAVERMIEDHLSWGNTHARWIRQENFDKGPAQFFNGAPEHLRAQLRADTQERVRQTMWGAGMGRHAEKEILELMTRSLTALSEILGDKPFLMGDNPCGGDAIAIAMLAGLLTPYFESDLRRRAESFENLSRYADRGMARYFPAYAWPTHEARIATGVTGGEIRAAA